EVKNVVEQPTERRTLAPILSTKEPDYSPSMGYENPNTTPKTESDEIIKSGVEELVPILSENEVTSEDKNKCDVPVCENSPICDYHFEIFSDSKNDDDISSDDDDFEDIEYVKASLPDPEIFSLEEENVVYHEEEDVDLEYVFQIQDIVLREKLLSINHLIANIESLNDSPTPDRLLNSSVSFPISEESDNSLSDSFSPEFEIFCDHTEETRNGNTTTHADDSLPEYESFCFEIKPDQERLINIVKNDNSDNSTNDPLLEEADLCLASDNSIPPGIENFAYDLEGDICFLEALLIDNSISNFKNELSNNESSESDFENPSFPRPPPEPPDADFEPNSGEEISVAMNDCDELECLDPKDVIDVSTNDDDVYSFFMFISYSKMFLSFLSAESEDTNFNLGKDYAKIIKNQSNPAISDTRFEVYIKSRINGHFSSAIKPMKPNYQKIENSSTYKVAKDLWERIQMLMQGTSLTKQETECKLYDAFDKFAYQKGETLQLSSPKTGLVVSVFQTGDDPIDAINHMMSFLTSVVTYRYPTTNNQFRTSSNPRQQATINDGRVTIQPIQGRQNHMSAEAIVVPDTEETLLLAPESRSKMIEKQNDPQMIEKKVVTKQINYDILNKLSIDFETCMVNSCLKKLKFHLLNFDMVVKEITTATAITEGRWGFEHTKACFCDDIIPFVQSLKELFTSFDQWLIDEVTEVQNFFTQIELAVEQHCEEKSKV
nr:hypothetical protein [Tanacetum cinerariifolium]